MDRFSLAKVLDLQCMCMYFIRHHVHISLPCRTYNVHQWYSSACDTTSSETSGCVPLIMYVYCIYVCMCLHIWFTYSTASLPPTFWLSQLPRLTEGRSLVTFREQVSKGAPQKGPSWPPVSLRSPEENPNQSTHVDTVVLRAEGVRIILSFHRSPSICIKHRLCSTGFGVRVTVKWLLSHAIDV